MVFVSEYFLSKRLKLVYSPHIFDNELVYIKPIEYNLNSNRIVDEDRLEKQFSDQGIYACSSAG